MIEYQNSIDSQSLKAISRCILHNLPFALFAKPNEGYTFFASQHIQSDTDIIEHQNWEGFLIKNFGLPQENRLIAIPRTLTVDQVLSLPEDYPVLLKAKISPLAGSTPQDVYNRQVEKIVETLSISHGKTVLSRIIALESSKATIDIINNYLSSFPATARFCYFTPQTGLWFGASPELLADIDLHTHTINTMALAGTRNITEDSMPWDKKNLEEHKFVSDYIIDKLVSIGLKVKVTNTENLKFGIIEHICDHIKAEGFTNPLEVIDILSPTPALCGTPQAEAIQQIRDTELFDRYCYGGWIAYKDKDSITAYVNLRSAFAAQISPIKTLYNIYVGSGLTKDSIAQSEWEETANKAHKILQILKVDE